MPLRFNGKFKSSICSTIMLIFLLPALYTPIAQAQSADAVSPVIDLHQVLQGIAGEVQVFTVEIENVDNLASVDFMHRFAGESEYRTAPMTLLEGTAVYTAYIDTEASDTRAIEYYIQALDNSGNRVLKGFNFEPFVRDMAQPDQVADTDPEWEIVRPSVKGETTAEVPAAATSETVAAAPVSEGRTGASKKWLWGLAGLVVVVAVAASLGGDSGDNATPEEISLQVTDSSRAVLSW